MSEENQMITVCKECLTASCWQGLFMCDASRDADIIQKTRKQLQEINTGEHESYWKTDNQLAAGR